MNIQGLLGRYKDFKPASPTGLLFEPDLFLAKEKKVCPLCFCKLYEMRHGNFWYCKSKKHKNRFLISKSKMA